MSTLTKTLSLKSIIKNIQTRRGWTLNELADALGIEGDQKSQARSVHQLLNRNESISWEFADWAINEWFATDEPLARAETALQAAHFSQKQIEILKETWTQFLMQRNVSAEEVAVFTDHIHDQAIEITEENFITAFWKWKFRKSLAPADVPAAPAPLTSPPPISAEEARAVQDLIALHLHGAEDRPGALAESKQWEILERASRNLARLCEPQQQPTPPADQTAHADSGVSSAHAGATVSKHRDKPTDHLQSSSTHPRKPKKQPKGKKP